MKNANDPVAKATRHNQLISHGPGSQDDYGELLQSIKSRLRLAGDLPGATVDQQIHLVDELSAFELGRFLLENRGVNAYWTHQLVTYRPGTMSAGAISDLEYRVFEKLPVVLATRERFGIFRQQLQALLRPGLALASIPCGLMGELLLLDYEQQPDVTLTGIDLDQQALNDALELAREQGLAERLSLRLEDAWTPSLKAAVDVVTSNGLNIYEPDHGRVTSLYRAFFDILKPGGTLITSFLTPPPTLSAESPWKLTEIDQESLSLQHLLFVRVIEAKWSAFRTHAQTKAQLENVGFADIRFIDDRARMFPTVIAQKPF
ncbi:SAM-dependent methyltransferase [Robbsia andropogonis]|uniref:SAM-dependent methyltransferase n=1 Tax=Robbsia andropogonis TaxID=28092 RepID=UPI003D220F61